MAQAIADGAKEVSGVNVRLTRVRETLPEEVLVKMGALEAQKAFQEVPVVTNDDLLWADAIIIGSPTRFGNVAAQMKTFLDSTGGLWATVSSPPFGSTLHLLFLLVLLEWLSLLHTGCLGW